MIIIIAEPGKKVHLGRIGENEARAVQFDISQTQAEFPGASFSVLNMRPQDPDAYPVNGQYIRIEGSNLYWTLQSGDLTEDGLGECELKATVDGVIVKSEIWTTEICPALDGNGEPPEPWESWQQQVEDDADRAEAAAEDSEAWAVGERGGEPVPEGDETYHNNAKYWADQAEETLASKADKTDTVLNTTLSRGRKANTTVGQVSFAFGYDVEASGAASHAEGYQTKASGTWSHAEGDETEASGQASHAEGYQTKAKGSNQHVSGVMNVEDNNNTFAEIVGNGFRAGSSIKRSNARALDWNGNEYLKGDLYVQCDKNSQNGSKVAKVSDIPEPVDISGKADKVEGAVAGHFAGLDENGNLTDSGSKASDFLTEHQDISGKADKVTGATNGNLAGLDGNGNLTDSGKKAADFVPVTSFRADAMPMSATDPKTVAQTATELKSNIDGKASIIRDTVQNVSIASVPDAAANLPLSALKFKVEPIQAGSGDPYPAGGGKNLLPTVIDAIKEINTNGTWSGNSYVLNGVTFTINTDAGGNVVGISTSGTASADASFYIIQQLLLPLGTYILNGCPSGGSTSTYRIFATNIGGSDTGSGVNMSADGTTKTTIRCEIKSGYNSSGLTFKPMVRLSSVSDGTFAPYQNIRPITGRTGAVVSVTGKNLFNPNSNERQWVTTGGVIENRTNCKSVRIPCEAGMQFTLSNSVATSTSNAILIAFLGEGDAALSRNAMGTGGTSVTATAPAGAKLCLASFLRFDIAENQQLEIGSTASSYTAYTGTTATVQFGSTVFGASVDYVGGQADDELTLFEFDGSEDESWVSNGANGYYITVDVGYKTEQTPIANYLVCLSNGASSGLGTWQGRMNPITSTGPANFLVKPDMATYDTLAKWKTYLSNNPLHVLLKKATHTTISLTGLDEIKTPLNGGTMNLWADSGDVVLMEYPCDTKAYMEKRLTASQSLMELIVTANREDSMKATRAYTTGNLLIVNGTLYRATTSIANGATLTPGTNVTATTVAAELAALA